MKTLWLWRIRTFPNYLCIAVQRPQLGPPVPAGGWGGGGHYTETLVGVLRCGSTSLTLNMTEKPYFFYPVHDNVCNFCTPVYEKHPVYETKLESGAHKSLKKDALSMTKKLKDHTLSSGLSPYTWLMGVPPGPLVPEDFQPIRNRSLSLT